MKKAFVAILSLAALVACSQDTVVKTSDHAAISFENFVENKTRAAADPSTTTANIEEFAVWGFRNTADELVFNNERVYKSGEEWTYDHLQYWMEGKDYFFGAVSPVNHEDVTVDTKTMSKDGLGTISFTNTDGSVDLIYAEKVVYASEINPSAPQPVNLKFAHLLSKVKFSMAYDFPNELTTVAVKDIKLANTPAEGTIDLTKERASWMWTLPQTGETVTMEFGDIEGGAKFSTVNEYYESDVERLLIPADVTRSYTITFTIEVYNNGVLSAEYPKTITLTNRAFVQGKSYNLKTLITPDNIVDGGLQPIEFEVIEVEDWDSYIDVDLDGEQTEEPVDPEEPTPGYKLYLENVDGWDKVFVYAWDAEGTQVLGEWPGVEMTEKETIDEVEYFAYTLSSELNGKTINVIFNNGNNGKQTADITGVELTKDNTFTNYVEPAKPTETKLYLKPNANWMADGARFAAYLWADGVNAVWYDMTLVEGETDIYEFTLPEGYDKLIFCRMNPGTTANDWNNKWNQTGDLNVPTDGKNLFTLAANVWDNATTTWGTYTPAEAPAEPEALATPVVNYEVEGGNVILTWDAVEGAKEYFVNLPEEGESYTTTETIFTYEGGYECTYVIEVTAIAADTEKNTNSEAAVVTATTEAAPVVGPTYTTVAEFLAAEIDDTTFYTLKGTITRVANTSYGNFDLTDETGTIYVYGLYSEDGVTSKYWAASGAKLGDDIVISAKRAEFGGSAQAGSARFMGLTSPGTLAFWSFSKTAVTFAAAGGQEVINVDAYNTTENISVVSDNEQFTATYADGALTITAKENATAESINGNITVTAGALKQVITVAQGGVSVGGEDVTVSAVMADQGWANAATVKQVSLDDNVVVTFAQGKASNAPAYYTSGNAVRLYQNGATMTVTANGKTIKSMEIKFSQGHYYMAPDCGEFSAESDTRVWTGEATEVKFTTTGTDKNHRAYISEIKVTYVD